MNRVAHSIQSDIVLFADDILVYRSIYSVDDEVRLQTDLDRIHDWCTTHQMTLNTTKTKVMHITRKRILQQYPIYTMNHEQLNHIPSHKYLGIIISSDLRWNLHVNSVVARANRLLGFIRTIARGASTQALFCLYRSLVLPILEYGIPAWHPHTAAQEHKLEQVQRAATRMALHQRRCEMSYEERLSQLHWTTLQSRRDCALCAYVMKCLSGTVKCEAVFETLQINDRHPNLLTFKHLPSRTQVLFLSPNCRFPRIWNSLPQTVRDAAVLSPLPSFLYQLKRSFISTQ